MVDVYIETVEGGETTTPTTHKIELSDGTNSTYITWSNVKAALKTYFDSLYAAITHTHAAGDITSGTLDNARLDGDLTAIANLSPANDDIIQRKSGAWTNRTLSQLATDLSFALYKYPCDFVLTLSSGNPYPTTDQTGKTTLYITPYGGGNQIALFNGSIWNIRTSAEFSIALGTLTASLPYDVFVYDNAGTPTAELLAWTNTTTRATSLTQQDGVYVKSGALTRRYIGTIFTASTTTTEDSLTKRFVWSLYHHNLKPLYKSLVSAHTYNPGVQTYRQWNADTTAKLEYVVGIDLHPLSCSIAADTYNGSAPFVGFGIDSTTTPNFELGFSANSSSSQIYGGAGGYRYYGIGYHAVNILQRASDTTNFTAFWAMAKI